MYIYTFIVKQNAIYTNGSKSKIPKLTDAATFSPKIIVEIKIAFCLDG